ncbi:MAG: hypothetical protein IT373_28010 [Polyangiaceae bacterium]|nr:hypothetical protein [Polyangiaceae bacterium]
MRPTVESLSRVAPRVAFAAILAAVMLVTRSAEPSVAEQRARLPPPAKCEDEVVGLWRSHQYNEMFAEWTIFQLEIRRKKGSETELEGRILNETWLGQKTDQEPGMCQGTVPWRFQVSMPAKGSYRNGEVSFQGTSWKLDKVVCGNLPTGFGYNLDHFTGKIDPAIQEFQSVNNDGGKAVNDPTVFRRVKCFDEGPEVRQPAHVDPPPFLPPNRTGGC